MNGFTYDPRTSQYLIVRTDDEMTPGAHYREVKVGEDTFYAKRVLQLRQGRFASYVAEQLRNFA